MKKLRDFLKPAPVEECMTSNEMETINVPGPNVEPLSYSDEMMLAIWMEVLGKGKEFKKEAKQKFYRGLSIIFSSFGISSDKSCKIFKKDRICNYLFEVSSQNGSELGEIHVTYGDFFDNLPCISIKLGRVRKDYEIVNIQTEDNIRLIPSNQFSFDENGNNVFLRRYGCSSGDIRYERDGYRVDVSFRRPNNGDTEDEILYLKGDDQLETFMDSLMFPIKISELYKSLEELIGPISMFEEFTLKVGPSNAKEQDVLGRETIKTKNGVFHEVTMFFGSNVAVYLNDKGTWLFRKKNVSIERNEEGITDFKISMSSREDGEKTLIPSDYIDAATEQVETVKRMTMQMLDDNKPHN